MSMMFFFIPLIFDLLFLFFFIFSFFHFFCLESTASSGPYLHGQVTAFMGAYLLSWLISFAIEILLLLVFTYTSRLVKP